MVRSRVVVALGALLGAATIVGPGCRTAPSVTLDVRMAKSELCPSIGGTAIVIASDRLEAESRATSYVTAETRDCDAASGSIGTLVLTRGPTGKSAVIVVVAFDKTRARTAFDCRPPAYAGCVVARRYFAHPEDRDLRLPITIEPACVDVPCNATSTCKKGNCYDSTTLDEREPGDDGRPVDGGTSGIIDSAVDGFTPDGSRDASDAGGDAASNDGGSEAGDELATCSAGILTCNGIVCPGGPTTSCCGNPPACIPSSCTNSTRRCCSTADCAANQLCAIAPETNQAGHCVNQPGL